MLKIVKSSICLLIISLISSCGFHLRGKGGTFQFPYKKVYLDCQSAIICDGLRQTIKNEELAILVNHRESSEAIIWVGNEQTSRDTYNFNSVGQIASYILTYQITVQVYNPKGDQIGGDMVVKNQMIMAYNNSLILSAQQQEDTTWGDIHENVINGIVRRVVYSKPRLVSSYVPESK